MEFLATDGAVAVAVFAGRIALYLFWTWDRS